MNLSEFTQRFRHAHEIGRRTTDTHLLVFFDNGAEVGLWRQDRGTTVGAGELLGPHAAAMTRYWYGERGRQVVERGEVAAEGRISDFTSDGRSR